MNLTMTDILPIGTEVWWIDTRLIDGSLGTLREYPWRVRKIHAHYIVTRGGEEHWVEYDLEDPHGGVMVSAVDQQFIFTSYEQAFKANDVRNTKIKRNCT